MSSYLTAPSSIAAFKGLAIAGSFITTGSLATISLVSFPSILQHTETDAATAQSASKQFAQSYDATTFLSPTISLSTAAFSFLAWYYRQHTRSESWKLFAGAAVAIFSTVPWSITMMEKTTQKLVALSHAKPKVAEKDKEPKLEHSQLEGAAGSSFLNVPGGSDVSRPPVTPANEFEPYEDSPFSTEEYEMEKVKKMLRQVGFRNSVRTFGPLLAGTLGLWATLV